MFFGLSVGRYITRVGQCRDSDASFVSSEMSVAPNTSHKRQSLSGYCGGPRNEKTCMGVASARPAKNQRHAFEDCLMSAVAFAFARHGDIPSRCRGAFESRCCTVSMDMMCNEVSGISEIQMDQVLGIPTERRTIRISCHRSRRIRTIFAVTFSYQPVFVASTTPLEFSWESAPQG